MTIDQIRQSSNIRWFPMWFTFLLFPIYTGIIVLVWRLRYKDDAK